MTPWVYEGREVLSLDDVPEGCVGFIYIISNVEGLHYIGKKQLWSTVTRPPLKGTRRKRKVTKESKWLTYKSSNKIVKEWEDYEITKRTIINWAYTKKHLTYLECHALFTLNVLKSDVFLNDNILGKFFRSDLDFLPND
tara:strand:- start:473 stop:889 length:417 start_codon:yes stop_codon:yes gene_type:complete